MKSFATFRNFVGFGQFASLSLRIEFRHATTGRVFKTFSLVNKVASYEWEHSSMHTRVLDRLQWLIDDACVELQSRTDFSSIDCIPSVVEALGAAVWAAGVGSDCRQDELTLLLDQLIQLNELTQVPPVEEGPLS